MTESFNETELREADLNVLVVFAALMRTRSVTRAGQRLGVGAPAVNMALAKLRGRFGDPLFIRTGRAMEPTARAEALFAEISPALGRIAAALRESGAFDPRVAQRTFRFASPDDLEIVLMPAIVARLAEEAPHIDLAVRTADFRVVPQMLRRNWPSPRRHRHWRSATASRPSIVRDSWPYSTPGRRRLIQDLI